MKRIFAMKMLMLLFMAISIFSFVLPIFAQGDAPPEPVPAPPVDIWTILIGAAVSLIITFSKRLTFVNENPKIVAMVLSLVFSVVASLAASKGGFWSIVQQFVVSLSAAVGTHEVLTKPLLKSGQ
jgi:peptidoglycan/LPS O-acetylase OafA/YrhL